MSFTLKRALEFNKFTTALAAAGLGYASTVASETSVLSAAVKLLGTAAIVIFAASVLFGALILGRATRIQASDDSVIDDKQMKWFGQAHSLTLLIGLVLTSLLMINKIWKLF